MKNKKLKVLIYIATSGLLISIGMIIGINIGLSRKIPLPVKMEEKIWAMGRGKEADAIVDNFWRFVDVSYILVGSPPDCEYYKIVSQVPRHDYVDENFYIEDGDDAMYYHGEDGSRKSLLVIDISTYQRDIDWEAVKNDGVDAVIIRVGYRGYGAEGKLVLDDMFTQHIEGAQSVGLPVGVYFFTQALNYEEGAEEAQFVLEAIKSYSVTYPVIIDTEMLDVAEARTYGQSVSDRTDAVIGFCETIKTAGYVPMVYANRNWYVQSLDMTRLGDYELWLAHYTNQTDFPYRFIGWQYTSEGQVAGISGSVDMNVWFRQD